jgi:hypothetical protein
MNERWYHFLTEPTPIGDHRPVKGVPISHHHLAEYVRAKGLADASAIGMEADRARRMVLSGFVGVPIFTLGAFLMPMVADALESHLVGSAAFRDVFIRLALLAHYLCLVTAAIGAVLIITGSFVARQQRLVSEESASNFSAIPEGSAAQSSVIDSLIGQMIAAGEIREIAGQSTR